MKQVILITHAAFVREHIDVHGPAHAVYRYLTRHTMPCVFLRYPIYGEFSAILTQGDGINRPLGGARIPGLLRPIWEVMMTVMICRRFRARKPLCIAVDPLNAFSCLLAKWLGFVEDVVFYTPDYTKERFGNRLLNAVYHGIDYLTAKSARHVWCVSRAIIAYRISQGIDKRKLYYVPNTPSVQDVGQVVLAKKDAHSLVMVGNIVATLDYSFVIDAVSRLRVLYPRLSLHIVGAGSHMKDLENEVANRSMQAVVRFHGQLSHDRVISLLKRCGVGVALYDGKCSTNLSGDSMKIREYVACGLPVITTDVTETAKLIHDYRAGEIVKIEHRAFAKALTRILDKNRYVTYCKNALQAAHAFDFDAMISRPLGVLSA